MKIKGPWKIVVLFLLIPVWILGLALCACIGIFAGIVDGVSVYVEWLKRFTKGGE